MRWEERSHGGRCCEEQVDGVGEEAIVGEYWLSVYKAFEGGVSSEP